MPSILRAAGNGIRQELDASLTDSGLSVTVDDGTPFNSAGGLIEIDYDNIAKRERVYYLSKSGNVLTIADDGRGLFGTTAVAHDTGALVRVYFVDEHINNLVDDYQAELSILESINNTGWKPVTDTWTYASATTITVPAGAASIYSVGDKIKFTQTTVKYANIITVADTLLTISGGSDYTVANAAITEIYHSRVENPIGFPRFFNFATSPAGFSGTPIANSWFNIHGRDVHFWGIIQGTSNSTGMYTTLPVTAVTYFSHSTYNHDWEGTVGYLANNNADVTTAARWRINFDQLGRIYFYTNMVNGAFASSNAKGTQWDVWYQI